MLRGTEKLMRRLALLPVLLFSLAGPAWAELKAGNDAYHRNDFAAALREWRADADKGVAAAQFGLGDLYENGLGTEPDPAQAAQWYERAANQDHGRAQARLGALYREGRGVARDFAKAAKWYRRAADRGHPRAQFNLGEMYATGQGVEPDPKEAYFWFNLAARNGYEPAAPARDKVGADLSGATFARLQRRLRQWRPVEGEAAPSRSLRNRRPASAGSGFVITQAGLILTSAHVVDSCREIGVKGHLTSGVAKPVAFDRDNDLALLDLGAGDTMTAVFRARGPVRLGASIVALGYPLQDIVGSGLNVSTGIVSALNGPGNDSRLLQVNAPVQPGNSGGPLLDMAGHVIGVVVSKRIAASTAEAAGDLPRYITFAVRRHVIEAFLAREGVDIAHAPSETARPIEDIAGAASRFTVMLECWP
jgi:TPR repeat protein